MFLPALDSHSLQFLLPLDFSVHSFLPCVPVGTALPHSGVESLLLSSAAATLVVSWLCPLNTASQQAPGLRGLLFQASMCLKSGKETSEADLNPSKS